MSVKIFLKSCDNLPHSTDVEWGNFSEPAGTIALSIHWISLNPQRNLCHLRTEINAMISSKEQSREQVKRRTEQN